MRKIITSLLVVGVVTAAGIGASQAFFSDTEVSNNNRIRTGTLAVDVNNNGSDGTFTLDLGTVALMPGQEAPAISILIRNTGTSDLAWFGYFGLSNIVKDLDKAVFIKSATMEFLPLNGWETTTGYEAMDPFITNGRGSGPYPSWYNTLADSDFFHVISLRTFTGSANSAMMGAGPGVFKGALKPFVDSTGEFAYKLTVVLAMHENAGNEYQGGRFDLNYTVKATQIDNDAILALNSDPVIQMAVSEVNWFNDQITKQNNFTPAQ